MGTVLADHTSVLLSVFLSRPQNLLALGGPVRNSQKSILLGPQLWGQAREWPAGGEACVSFGGLLRCRLGQADPVEGRPSDLDLV